MKKFIPYLKIKINKGLLMSKRKYMVNILIVDVFQVKHFNLYLIKSNK